MRTKWVRRLNVRFLAESEDRFEERRVVASKRYQAAILRIRFQLYVESQSIVEFPHRFPYGWDRLVVCSMVEWGREWGESENERERERENEREREKRRARK